MASKLNGTPLPQRPWSLAAALGASAESQQLGGRAEKIHVLLGSRFACQEELENQPRSNC